VMTTENDRRCHPSEWFVESKDYARFVRAERDGLTQIGNELGVGSGVPSAIM